MKAYNLVIENTLEELIGVTNEAIALGYKAVGGMKEIQGKYIQTIILNNSNNNKKNKSKMEQTFFQDLAQILQDKQIVKITITKVGDNLTLLINKDNKLIQMTGSPAEVDDGILPHLKVSPTQTTEFTVTTTDAPEVEEEEEEEEEELTPEEKEKMQLELAAKVKAKKEAKKKPSKKEAKKADEEKKSEGDDIHKKNLGETLVPEVSETTPPPVEGNSEKFKELMSAGAKALAERKYTDAVGHYEEAMKIAPEGNTSAKTEYERALKWKKAVDSL